MSIIAKISAAAGRVPAGTAARRLPIWAALAVASAGLAASGCQSPSPAAAAAAAPVTASPSSPAAPPARASGSPAAPSAPSAALPQAAASSSPAAAASGPAPASGALSARISGITAGSALVPGGPAVQFTVTVTNSTAHGYSGIAPLVSMSHCACTPSSLFPAGTLRELSSQTGSWRRVPYDVEGFGTDFLMVTQQAGIQLPAGASESFEYRVALSPATSAQVTRAMGSIDVTLIALPAHTQIGVSPAAGAPIDVQSGQPPA
jgi:hypothetical protein